MSEEKVNLLILIRGVAGSGKTTLANRLLELEPGRFNHYEADMFYTDENGNYHFQLDQLGNAYTWCQRVAEKSMQDEEDIIISNTSTTPWELELYLKLSTIYNYEVLIYDMPHEYKSIHDVPPEVLSRQKKNFVRKELIMEDESNVDVKWYSKSLKELVQDIKEWKAEDEETKSE